MLPPPGEAAPAGCPPSMRDPKILTAPFPEILAGPNLDLNESPGAQGRAPDEVRDVHHADKARDPGSQEHRVLTRSR